MTSFLAIFQVQAQHQCVTVGDLHSDDSDSVINDHNKAELFNT